VALARVHTRTHTHTHAHAHKHTRNQKHTYIDILFREEKKDRRQGWGEQSRNDYKQLEGETERKRREKERVSKKNDVKERYWDKKLNK